MQNTASNWQAGFTLPWVRQTCAIESRARRLYEARIHGRGPPVWYGGVALRAPQKRRDGSACESRWLIYISRRKSPRIWRRRGHVGYANTLGDITNRRTPKLNLRPQREHGSRTTEAVSGTPDMPPPPAEMSGSTGFLLPPQPIAVGRRSVRSAGVLRCAQASKLLRGLAPVQTSTVVLYRN